MRARPLLIQSAGLAVERRGLTARIAALSLVISLVTLAASVRFTFRHYEAEGGVLLLIVGSLMAALLSATVALRHRFDPARSAAAGARSRGEVQLGEEGLTVTTRQGARTFAPGSLADGWIDDPGEVASVVLRTHGGDVISIEVESIEAARAVLLAAGVSAEQQALTMRLANAMTQIPLGGLLAAFGGVVFPLAALLATLVILAPAEAGSRGTGALVLAIALLLFGLLVRALIPQRIVIGTDGIAVDRLLGRVFVPHARVTEVVSATGAVVLQIRDARPLRLPTGARYRGSRTRADESTHTALLHRLAEARAAGRAGVSRGLDAADLDRAGRSLGAWREHLRGLTAAASYRRPDVAPEQIAAVLEDGGAPPERRVAAALALAPLGDAALKLRIADVVRTSADASLRAALQAAAEDELTEAELSPLLKKQVR